MIFYANHRNEKTSMVNHDLTQCNFDSYDCEWIFPGILFENSFGDEPANYVGGSLVIGIEHLWGGQLEELRLMQALKMSGGYG